MTRAEVLARMEEIVAFSGCERYIDTPVKRYSSGMTVRLGFAVAAHLDPEILIVDEVLAVGDAEFQRKCLGKMQDVAGQGRTVLFVSHNMGMIDRLCGRCLLIDRGGIVADGATSGVIQQYFRLGEGVLDRGSFKGGLAADIQVTGVSVNGVAGRQLLTVSPSQDIAVTFRGTASRAFDDIRLTLSLFTAGLQVVTVHDTDDYARLDAGAFESTITIPRYLLRPGEYAIGIGGLRRNEEWFFGRNLAHIRILEEWDAQCDYSCAGILNLPHRPGMGRRRRVAATEGAS
jgi:lipopolysaccharide transport system ATP-binding protein